MVLTEITCILQQASSLLSFLICAVFNITLTIAQRLSRRASNIRSLKFVYNPPLRFCAVELFILCYTYHIIRRLSLIFFLYYADHFFPSNEKKKRKMTLTSPTLLRYCSTVLFSELIAMYEYLQLSTTLQINFFLVLALFSILLYRWFCYTLARELCLPLFKYINTLIRTISRHI